MDILITGVSSGIGWGLSKYYLSKGDTIYGVSRRIPKDLMKYPNFKHLSTDLSKLDKINANFQPFIRSITSLDIVVLNAGILGEIKDLKKQSIEDINSVMDINVWSNKVLIDILTKSIINIKSVVAISSGVSVKGNRGWGAYSISKASLNMLIQLYAAENKATSFYALAPGLVDTDMQNYLCSDKLNTTLFPASQKLINARNTDLMPLPLKAGELLANGILKLQKLPSGSFSDIRKMV